MRVHEFAKLLSEETGKAITTNQVLLLLSKKREGLRTMSNLDDELMEYARMRLSGAGKKADDKKTAGKKPQDTMVRKAGPVKRPVQKKDAKPGNTGKTVKREVKPSAEGLSLRAKAELYKQRKEELAEAAVKPKVKPVVGAIVRPSDKAAEEASAPVEKTTVPEETAATPVTPEVKEAAPKQETAPKQEAEVKKAAEPKKEPAVKKEEPKKEAQVKKQDAPKKEAAPKKEDRPRKDAAPKKDDRRPRPDRNAAPDKAEAPVFDGRKDRGRKDKDRNDRRDKADNTEDKPRKSERSAKKDRREKFDRDYDGEVKQRPKKKKDDAKAKKEAKPAPQPPKKEEETIKTIVIPETLTLKELADKIKTPVNAMIKKLFLEGKMLTVNTDLSFDDAADIALEYNVICEQEEKVDIVEEMLKDIEDDPESLTPRPPVVCVMGHVDHGKTSLLDAIRKTNVTEDEAGGITQHIGAYTVKVNDQKITFLDTPGHEAFTAMRMRGAKSTDSAILVVAADDGVMPQTVEAINHAKAAGIEIIVAVNKIDKPSANIERVKQELVEHELIAEDWGGTTIFCPVSAHTKEGIDNLLDMILLTADVLELKANKDRKARGVVIEASLDKGRGPVASLLVQKGTLHVGDFLSIGEVHGKVRAMIDDKQRRVKEATPSTPVEIIGLNGVPNSGDIFISTETEKEAKAISDAFITRGKENLIAETKRGMSLDDLFTKMQEGTLKELDIIIKADVQGSVEAVKQSLLKLSNEEIMIKCIHAGVGAVNESDVTLASASDAIIIAFNTKVEPMARTLADQEKVDLRQYRVIYNAIDDIESAMKGMLDPIFEESVIGHAEIRQVFKASGIGNIAGSYVLDGSIERNSSARVSRDGELIFEGKIASVKRFKDDVKEVKAGFECGLVFEGFNDIREGDQIEAYKMVEVPR